MEVYRKLALILFLSAMMVAAPRALAMDKNEVEGIIREYIKAHPQEISAAMKKYEADERAAAQEAAVKQALANRKTVPTNGSPSTGPATAPITVVEFSDFQCPYCARSVGTITQLMANHKGQIRLVFKNAPLPFHDKAPGAAKAAMAAEAQGKFWEYREVLMTKQNEWSQSADPKANFVAYAKDMKMDGARFEKDMSNPAFQKRLDDDKAVGAPLGVQGTPTYFINGAMVVGAQELSQFERIVAEVAKDKPGK
jgi:protein-disulfide isomerase